MEGLINFSMERKALIGFVSIRRGKVSGNFVPFEIRQNHKVRIGIRFYFYHAILGKRRRQISNLGKSSTLGIRQS